LKLGSMKNIKMLLKNKKQDLVPKSPPLLIVISGPSGAGKDATLTKMKETGYLFHHVVTVTTRPKRKDELDRVHYRFISEDQFQKMVKSKKLLEWAKVYGNYYGVPRDDVKQALDGGQDVIIKVDVQGATTIKRMVPEAVFIFIAPPSMDELAERLKQRNNHQSLSDLKVRLNKAKEELESLSLFDYCVINRKNNIGLTVSRIHAIIAAEKCRVTPRLIKL
jgi:guanylate kinase